MSDDLKNRTLDEISSDCNHQDDFLKDVLMHGGMRARHLTQMYMVWKFKWNWGMNWDEAWNRWVDEGYSAAFARVYQTNPLPMDCYRALLDFIPKNESFDDILIRQRYKNELQSYNE